MALFLVCTDDWPSSHREKVVRALAELSTSSRLASFVSLRDVETGVQISFWRVGNSSMILLSVDLKQLDKLQKAALHRVAANMHHHIPLIDDSSFTLIEKEPDRAAGAAFEIFREVLQVRSSGQLTIQDEIGMERLQPSNRLLEAFTHWFR